MKKEIYLDLMEKVVSAYDDAMIKKYTEDVMQNGLREHGYPRLVANLGILIAHGRKTEYSQEFCKMMDLCCNEIPSARLKYGYNVGNDFSVREIVMCLLELEKAKVFDNEITDRWRKKLSSIKLFEVYSAIAAVPPLPKNNWSAMSAASEQLRKYAGIGDESAFVENQIKSQLMSFDENGMYRDPNEPMVYDIVTRLELAVILYFGFDGESRSKLENELLKSADITLDMQSVTGEIPFGGRSNQFLHNEATFAALCEFYADFFKKRNELNKAGQFKSAAKVAVDSIIPWLKEESMHHIKNYYDIYSKFGCEDYAYFDKYMITTASCLYQAYVMADDEIDEVDCPAISKNCICQTSEHFHKVMCRYNEYFVEFEMNADEHYDASGLGRIHKKGAPSAICIAVPFCKKPSYLIDIENPEYLSICAGIKIGNEYVYMCDPSTEYTLVEKLIANDFVRVRFECKMPNGITLHETCTLSDEGVEIEASGEGEMEILFPMFKFDGLNYSEISVSEKNAVITYKGYKCIYSTNGIIADKKQVYANRNGHYNAATAVGKNRILLKIEIAKA